MNADQQELRNMLNQAVNQIGLKAKVISVKTGILQPDLSRFKNGQILLCTSDADKLEKYLDSFHTML